jgi:hypothetical protein
MCHYIVKRSVACVVLQVRSITEKSCPTYFNEPTDCAQLKQMYTLLKLSCLFSWVIKWNEVGLKIRNVNI